MNVGISRRRLLETAGIAVDPLIAAQTVMAMVNSSAYLRPWLPGDDAVAVERLYVRPSLMGLFTPD